jgi:hypothetical protein
VIQLYTQARRRLLQNQPVREDAIGLSVVGALSAGEAASLGSVGLCTARWERSVAELFKVKTSRIQQRPRERSLLGIADNGRWRLPRFPFERGQVLPGLREVLAVLSEALNPLDVAVLTPEPDLELGDATISPRDGLLRGGSVATVVELARRFGDGEVKDG